MAQSQINKQQREQQIKLQKLQEKQKQKEKLEKEMYLLNTSIDEIKDTNKKKYYSPNRRQEYEQHQKNIKDIEQKHKQLQLERLELEKQRKLRIQKEEEQKQKQIEEQKQKEEQEKNEKLLKKKDELKKHYEQMQIKQKERELERKKYLEQSSQVLQRKPLYQQKQEQYQKIQEQSLQEKKLQLQNIRNLHKPLDINDLKEHEKKYMEQRMEKKQKQQEEKQQSNSFHYKPSYKSENYYKFQEEIKLLKDQQDNLKLKPLVIKQHKVQDYVKKIKKPAIDPKLIQERERNIENTRPKGLKHKIIKDENGQPKLRAQSSKQIGNDYLKKVNEICRNARTNREKTEQDSVQNSSRFSDPKSIQSLDRRKRTVGTVDYVAQFRKQRMEREQKYESNDKKNEKWKEILNNENMGEEDKQKKILMEVKKMQERAKRKEQLLKLKGSEFQGGEDDQQVNDLYIKSIQAKIALLGIQDKTQINNISNTVDII